jgi:hypothetical protein
MRVEGSCAASLCKRAELERELRDEGIIGCLHQGIWGQGVVSTEQYMSSQCQ